MLQRRNPRRDFETLRADVEKLRTDIGNLSGSVRHTTAQRARGAQRSLLSELQDGRAELERWLNTARKSSRHAWRDAEAGLSHHSFSTAAVAFGLGVGVAVLAGALSRRSRHRRYDGRARTRATEFGEDLT